MSVSLREFHDPENPDFVVASVLYGPDHTDQQQRLLQNSLQTSKVSFYLAENRVRGACEFAFCSFPIQNNVLTSAWCTFFRSKKTDHHVVKNNVSIFLVKNEDCGA